MTLSRILAVAIVVFAFACTAIPSQDINSLLASQGVVAPLQVQQERNRGGDPSFNFFISVLADPNDVGSEMCKAHLTIYKVSGTHGNYQIRRDHRLQEIAFKGCAAVNPSKFVPIINRDMDWGDAALNRAVETAFALPKLAAVNDSMVRIRFDQDQLRAALTRMDLGAVQQFVPYSPDSFIVSYGFGRDQLLNVSVAFQDGRLTDAHVFTGQRAVLRVGN